MSARVWKARHTIVVLVFHGTVVAGGWALVKAVQRVRMAANKAADT